MSNGDLYPKGKKLFHVRSNEEVEYVCATKGKLHIVLATPKDFLDDRVREVYPEDLVDETVQSFTKLEARSEENDCLDWIRKSQVGLYQSYQRTLGGYVPEGASEEGGFFFYAIFQYEANKLKSSMAPGSKTRQ